MAIVQARRPAGREAGGESSGESGAITRPYAVLRIVAYPVLFGTVLAVGIIALRRGWEPGPVSALTTLGVIGYLALFERLIPYERSWHPTRSEWRHYGIYFVSTAVAAAAAQLPVLAIVAAVAIPKPAMPLGLEIPLALLLGSLAGYIVHRLGHTTWLWRLHGIHHVPDKVNVANNGVDHVLDVLIAQFCVQLALALARFSESSVLIVGLFVILQGYFIHANIDVRIGWLNYVLASPEQHRLHHSTKLTEAGNYGSDLSIWDRLFGSFTWAPGRRPAAIGLVNPTSFPPTGAILASLVHPWRRRPAVRGVRAGDGQ